MKLLLVLSFFSTLPFYFTNDLNKLEKFLDKNYALVPDGAILLDGESIQIQSFYMFKNELTVLNYREFLYEVKQSGDTEWLNKVSPVNPSEENATYLSTYYSHPAYDEYPIVNISAEAAQEYCYWLAKKLAIKFEVDVDQLDVRLPTKAEWVYAAQGGNSNNIYAWEGAYLRDKDGKFLANFRKDISQENISFDTHKNEYIIITDESSSLPLSTTPADSYMANAYGLFNMSGNVAEYVVNADGDIAVMGGSFNSPGYDIRVHSQSKYLTADLYSGFRPIVRLK